MKKEILTLEKTTVADMKQTHFLNNNKEVKL